MKIITSTDNSFIKKLRSLSVKKYREQFGLCLVEGEKVVKEALKIEGLVEGLVIAKSFEEKFSELIQNYSQSVTLVTDEIFNSLASAVTPQGIIAIIKTLNNTKIDLNKNIVVLDHLQDPGNLGTIIRSGIASNHSQFILIDSVDPYNDKTIRSATGTIFYASFFKMNKSEFKEFAKLNSLNLLIADMGGKNIFASKSTLITPYALVIGSEGQGVSEDLLALNHKTIAIPMDPRVESLNAGVSASIIMFNLSNSFKGKI